VVNAVGAAIRNLWHDSAMYSTRFRSVFVTARQDFRNNANFLLLLLSMATRMVAFGSTNKVFDEPAHRTGTQAARQRPGFAG
jgi:hypothetical protein